MEKLYLHWERLADDAHYGLTDQIGKSVRDYYDLLFDNVNVFIDINREELEEYRIADAELGQKMENKNISEAERQTLIAERTEIWKRSESLKEFMESNRILDVGIELSGEILDDCEPELTDQFNAAPVTEKYCYLVNRYKDEYRADLKERIDRVDKAADVASMDVEEHLRSKPLFWDNMSSFGNAGRQWKNQLDVLKRLSDNDWRGWMSLSGYSEKDSLVDMDAFRFGVDKVRELFPKIDGQHQELMEEKYKELLKDDPVKLYGDLLAEYALAYVADTKKLHVGMQCDCEVLCSQLLDHEEAKPNWFRNAITLGSARESWEKQQESLVKKISEHRERIAELSKLCGDAMGAWLSESARDYATQAIESLHPEVEEACNQYRTQRLGQINGVRLGMQGEEAKTKVNRENSKKVFGKDISR